jgi:hypothetical protein
MLYGLASVLEIEHEHELPGGRPDLWFSVSQAGKQVQVVGDVTTLSDTASNEANDFHKLSDTVHAQARNAGPSNGVRFTYLSQLTSA